MQFFLSNGKNSIYSIVNIQTYLYYYKEINKCFKTQYIKLLSIYTSIHMYIGCPSVMKPLIFYILFQPSLKAVINLLNKILCSLEKWAFQYGLQGILTNPPVGTLYTTSLHWQEKHESNHFVTVIYIESFFKKKDFHCGA